MSSLSSNGEPGQPSLPVPGEDADPDRTGANGSLGQAVGRGFSWISLGLLSGKLCSFATQLILGSLLLEEDFGLIAIVVSIASVMRIFQDGGVANVLVQKGNQRFDLLSGTAFWIGVTLSLAAGLLLILLSPLIASIYDDRRMIPLIIVTAISLPLSAPAAVLMAKLRLDFRFRSIAVISTMWFLLRYVAIVPLAARGWGAMSFMLPLPFVALFEVGAMYAATRIQPWKRAISREHLRELLSGSLWVVLAAVFRGMARFGDYIILGLILSQKVVGQYFFGYQLTSQIIALFATGVQQVLLPVLSRLAEDTVRQSHVIIRIFRILVLTTAPLSVLLALCMRPVELLLWHGKWAPAVTMMQIFAIAAPLRMFPEVIYAGLTARGAFRKCAWLILLEGALLMLVAGAAGLVFGANLTALAACVATMQVVYGMTLSAVLLRPHGIAVSRLLAACLPAWLVSVAAAAITALVQWQLPTNWHLLIHITLTTVIFLPTCVVLLRALLPAQLSEMASILPHRLKAVVSRILFIAGDAPPARLWGGTE